MELTSHATSIEYQELTEKTAPRSESHLEKHCIILRLQSILIEQFLKTQSLLQGYLLDPLNCVRGAGFILLVRI